MSSFYSGLALACVGLTLLLVELGVLFGLFAVIAGACLSLADTFPGRG